MNNAQFRNLVKEDKSKSLSSSSNVPAFKPPMLGSRARPSVPMTPRSVFGRNPPKDFAHQVGEMQKELDGQPPTKKIKTTGVPKGTKLPQGYEDRSLLRRSEDEAATHDDKATRFKALEEMMKLQQIDQATFEKLRDEIGVGGDVSSTHLVKGLDWKLLDRVRRGEDVSTVSQSKTEAHTGTGVDVDEELDVALQKDITTVEPSEDHPVAPEQASTQSMTRNEILRQLKESRKSKNAPPPEVSLGDKFIKVAKKADKERFIEKVNGRRREVLFVTNPDGSIKKKTRWLDPEAASAQIISPATKAQQPLGMQVPAEFAAKQKALIEAEMEDEDIFAGVGDDYNPLANMSSDEEASEHGDGKNEAQHREDGSAKLRNYFAVNGRSDELEDKSNPIARDPMLLAALKRAAAIRKTEEEKTITSEGGEEASKVDHTDRQKQLLARLKQRDMDDSRDLDMGFGESRFGDEDDEDGPVWNEDGPEDEKKLGRKRGSKKRKGDENNVADVMSVLEKRNKPGG